MWTFIVIDVVSAPHPMPEATLCAGLPRDRLWLLPCHRTARSAGWRWGGDVEEGMEFQQLRQPKGGKVAL